MYPKARYERLNNDELDEKRQQGTKHHIIENEEIELEIEHKHRNVGDSMEMENSAIYNNGKRMSIKGDSAHKRQYGNGTSNNEIKHHLPGSRFMQMAICTVLSILLYLILSISLTFYQKYILERYKYPLTIVSYHLVIKLLLAAIVRFILKTSSGKPRVQIDWRSAVRKMAPTGIASGIDIGFSNWGLEFVSISLYTMTKSSTIVFILFFAILLGLEKKTWSIVMIVGLIAIGLFMFTYKSTQFNALGFIFVLVASLSSGVRWSFAQFVMQKSKLGLHNPVDMIYYMQPWMIASLLPFVIGFERQKLYTVFLNLPTTSYEAVVLVFIKISIGAVLAFIMEVSEFLVLSKTSSLTLSIVGIFKDICQLALAVELNGDLLSIMNVIGLTICMAGICGHLIHKYTILTKIDELNTYTDELSSYYETNINTANGNLISGHQQNIHNKNNHTTTTIASSSSSTTTAGFYAGHNNGSFSKKKNNNNNNSLTVPLLNQIDTDDEYDDYSNNDDNEQNASEVIFDVLKRRDMQR